MTIADLGEWFLEHARQRYASKPSRLGVFKVVLRQLIAFAGSKEVEVFGPLALRSFRERFGGLRSESNPKVSRYTLGMLNGRVAAVVGKDRSESTVASNAVAGRKVVRGDALDTEFWDRLRLHPGIVLVVLAMSDHAANLEAARKVRTFLPNARSAAAASYAADVAELAQAGVDVARNLYGGAGQGLAGEACDPLGAPRDPHAQS